PPPRSPPFPYTTLFRSNRGPPAPVRPSRITAPRTREAPSGVRRLSGAPQVPTAPPTKSGRRTPRRESSAVARADAGGRPPDLHLDRKSTRLNSSHVKIS